MKKVSVLLMITVMSVAKIQSMDQSALLGKSGEGFRKRQPIKLNSVRNSQSEISDSQIEQSSSEDVEIFVAPPSPALSSRVSSKPLPVPPSRNSSQRTSTAEDASRISQFAVITDSPALSKRPYLKLERVVPETDTDTDSPSGNDSSLSPERNEGSVVESHSPKKWVSAQKKSPLSSPTVSPRIGVSTNRISQSTPLVSPRTSQSSVSNENSNNDPVVSTPPLSRTRNPLEFLENSSTSLQRSRRFERSGGLSIDEQFHLAVKRGDLVKATALLKDGADINSLDRQGQSALDFAAMTRSSGLTQFLKAQGAISKTEEVAPSSVSPASPEQKTLVVKQATNGYYDPGLDGSDSPSGSPLASPKSGTTSFIEKLKDTLEMSDGSTIELDHSFNVRLSKFNDEFRALILKDNLFQKDMNRLQALLREGADINSLNSKGIPPLLQLLDKEHPSFDAIKFLINHGANLDFQGMRSAANGKGMVKGPTVLQEAARKGNLRLVNALLEGKANPNLADGNGTTPLMSVIYARDTSRIKGEPTNVTIARLLINAGADLFAKNARGQTAYEAAREVHMARYLAEYLERKEEEKRAGMVQQSVVEALTDSVLEHQK